MASPDDPLRALLIRVRDHGYCKVEQCTCGGLKPSQIEAALSWVVHEPTPWTASGATPPQPSQPCVLCGSPTDAFAADPGAWPVMLARKSEPGVAKPHCTRCVTAAVEANAVDYRACALRAFVPDAERISAEFFQGGVHDSFDDVKEQFLARFDSEVAAAKEKQP